MWRCLLPRRGGVFSRLDFGIRGTSASDLIHPKCVGVLSSFHYPVIIGRVADGLGFWTPFLHLCPPCMGLMSYVSSMRWWRMGVVSTFLGHRVVGRSWLPTSGRDHDWNGTVVRVFSPWEAASKSDRGLVPLLMEHGSDLLSCGANLGGSQGSNFEVVRDLIRLLQLELAVGPEQAYRASGHSEAYDQSPRWYSVLVWHRQRGGCLRRRLLCLQILTGLLKP